ncbi:MAG: class I SAM-dependent methyltransferase [Rhodospirillaceae bacterium]|nr:class I SAM-dependent methyltransferase [Rhodospirillaceae bacterium]
MNHAHTLAFPAAAPHDDNTIPVFARRLGSWQFTLRRRALRPDELAARYDQAAPGWSRTLDRLGVPNAYETLLRTALKDEPSLYRAPQARVLDCGIGTGALSAALADALPVPFALKGVDISTRMLARARARLYGTGIQSSLQQGDIQALPFDSNQFDLAMTAHVLEHLAHPETALREMFRVVKPGGLILVCLTRRSPLGAYVQLKWRTHRVTGHETETWLRDAGLENVRCLPLRGGVWYRQLSVACIGRKPETLI